MKRTITIWGSRLLTVLLLAFAVNKYGVPIYKKNFTPKKAVVYVPTAQVKEGPFTVSFHQVGTLAAEKSIFVSSKINGKLISLVTDGSIVKAGDRIALLDVTDLEREMRNQRLAYENSLADVERAKNDLEIFKDANQTELAQVQADLDFNKTELERARKQLEKKIRLANDKLLPRSEIDEAELQIRSRELTVLKGEKSLALKKREIMVRERQKGADIRNVEFKSNMARTNYEDTVDKADNTVITAPAPGLVVLSKIYSPDGRRKIQPGDNVNPRLVICELPDLSKMQVKVLVGESDVSRVSLNMLGRIKLDANAKKLFSGKIIRISNLATEGNAMDPGTAPGRKVFEVLVAVKESGNKLLKPGMTADVEFIKQQIDHAVYVPIEAVVEKDGKTWAFVRKAGKFKRVEIKAGVRNDNYVVVTKGLSPGMTIALTDPFNLDKDKQEDKGNGDKAVPVPGGAGK